jgi:glycosyltransferase involved in cell wall biosynthesis
MNILALVESPDHVCCRYRIRAFAPALANAGHALRLESLPPSPVDRARQWLRARHADIVILQRKLLAGWQLAMLRRAARHFVFDFDDAVVFRDSYDARGPHCPRRRHRFTATMKAADAVLAGNAFLAQLATDAGARPDRVAIVPTCVEPDRYPRHLPSDSEPSVHLTWIGSSSTLKGIEAEQALWDRLGQEIPGLRMRVIADRFPRFENLPVDRVLWAEATEAEALARGDIGLAWMPDDLWSRGKCGLKVLQYQAAGLPVVANPVGVHPEMIQPGVHGYLPGTPAEWVESVRMLAADPGLRRRLGTAARASVETRYSVAAWGERWVRFVTGRSGPASSAAAPRHTLKPIGKLAGQSLNGEPAVERTGAVR